VEADSVRRSFQSVCDGERVLLPFLFFPSLLREAIPSDLALPFSFRVFSFTEASVALATPTAAATAAAAEVEAIAIGKEVREKTSRQGGGKEKGSRSTNWEGRFSYPAFARGTP
jgi:hypothetical protein